MSVKSKMTAIADAIREKTGKTGTLTLDQMAEEISGISVNDDYLGKLLNKQVSELVSPTAAGTIPAGFQQDNLNLTKVDMPMVAIVSDGAFASCKNLQSVNLPSLVEIKSNAFSICSSLTKLYLPNLEKISGWGYTFQLCSFEKVYFPKVTEITSPFCWYNNAYLKTLILGADTVCTLSNSNAFNLSAIATGTGHIYVKKSLLSSYQSASNWSVYSSQFRAIEDHPEVLEGWE